MNFRSDRNISPSRLIYPYAFLGWISAIGTYAFLEIFITSVGYFALYTSLPVAIAAYLVGRFVQPRILRLCERTKVKGRFLLAGILVALLVVVTAGVVGAPMIRPLSMLLEPKAPSIADVSWAEFGRGILSIIIGGVIYAPMVGAPVIIVLGSAYGYHLSRVCGPGQCGSDSREGVFHQP